jgi:hypothetical protein
MKNWLLISTISLLHNAMDSVGCTNRLFSTLRGFPITADFSPLFAGRVPCRVKAVWIRKDGWAYEWPLRGKGWPKIRDSTRNERLLWPLPFFAKWHGPDGRTSEGCKMRRHTLVGRLSEARERTCKADCWVRAAADSDERSASGSRASVRRRA